MKPVYHILISLLAVTINFLVAAKNEYINTDLNLCTIWYDNGDQHMLRGQRFMMDGECLLVRSDITSWYPLGCNYSRVYIHKALDPYNWYLQLDYMIKSLPDDLIGLLTSLPILIGAITFILYWLTFYCVSKSEKSYHE
jgi:hypothetical protein